MFEIATELQPINGNLIDVKIHCKQRKRYLLVLMSTLR